MWKSSQWLGKNIKQRIGQMNSRQAWTVASATKFNLGNVENGLKHHIINQSTNHQRKLNKSLCKI